MSEIEVLELILRQIGELRVPMREETLRKDLGVIAGNVQALLDAMGARLEEKQAPEATEEAGENVQS